MSFNPTRWTFYFNEGAIGFIATSQEEDTSLSTTLQSPPPWLHLPSDTLDTRVNLSLVKAITRQPVEVEKETAVPQPQDTSSHVA